MKHIVITGGTRGIGFGLARSFLQLGCRVTLCGRRRGAVDEAVRALSEGRKDVPVAGTVCNVADEASMNELWDFARQLAPVDIWINNAGIAGPNAPILEVPAAEVKDLIETNLLGALHGCRVAGRGMALQGHGHLYNMEGFGSDGRILSGLSVYGASKRALRYLTTALSQELAGTPVKVSALSPGMVTTDLLMNGLRARPEQLEKGRKVLNVLADRVETVTPWLAGRILRNEKSGTLIAWLTPAKVMLRFLSMPFSRRKVIDEP